MPRLLSVNVGLPRLSKTSKHLKKALIERAFGAELTVHLGYEKADPAKPLCSAPWPGSHCRVIEAASGNN